MGHCVDCNNLMFSDCYGECSMAHKGIVSPDDSCEYFEPKFSPEDVAMALIHCTNGGKCETCPILDKEYLCKNLERLAADCILRYVRLLEKENSNEK